MLLSASLAASSYDRAEHGYPIVAGVVALLALVSYVACFVIAAKTGKLKALDYVIGTLGAFCGIGWIYFLWRANSVTLQHSFDLINEGGDPAASRALNKRFKIAAGAAIAFGVLSFFLR